MFKILFFESGEVVKVIKLDEIEYAKNKAKGFYDNGEDSIFNLGDKKIVDELIKVAMAEKKEVLFVEPPGRSLLAAMF